MILLLLALLAGPARADDPLPPDLPAAFTYAVPGSPSASPWWAGFGDPALEGLVRQALDDNGDLSAFDARVRQSEAVSRQMLAPLLPSASLDFSGSTAPRSVRCAQLAAQIGGDSASMFSCDDEGWYQSGSGVVSAAWALDIWGANTQSWRSSRFDAMAMAGDRDAQLLAMAATVANAWYDVEATRAQIDIIREQIAAGEEVLSLVELRYEGGDAAAPEVLQQRQQLASSRAQLPQAEARLRSLERQLAALLGDVGASIPAGSGALPGLPPAPPTGTPADLVDARPDLRSARLDLDSAEARRKAAVRGTLPSLGVSASAGYQTFNYEDLDSFVETASVGASLSVPLLQGGYNVANVQAAKANEDAALRSFEQAARQAVYEVDDARQRELAQEEVVTLLVEQERLARQSFEDTRDRYEAGLSRYVDVLTAQNAWKAAQVSLLSGQRELLRARIDLHDALGGPWVASLSDGAR